MTNSELANELKRAMEQLRRLKLSFRNQSELSDGEWYVLWLIATLNDGAPVHPSDISDQLGVTLAAVTHRLTTLEASGYIVRQPASDDRRTVQITLSVKGKTIRQRFHDRYWEKLRGLVDHLGEPKTRQLISLMDDVGNYLRIRHGNKETE